MHRLLSLCDPFSKNLSKSAETTIEIQQKVGEEGIYDNIQDLYFINPLP